MLIVSQAGIHKTSFAGSPGLRVGQIWYIEATGQNIFPIQCEHQKGIQFDIGEALVRCRRDCEGDGKA